MNQKNVKLAVVLLACLVLFSAAALWLDDAAAEGNDGSRTQYAIVINEICTKNETIIADNDGKYRDYIELYNGGDPVSLEGFTLTDGKVTCQPFGTAVMETGEYRLVFLGDSVTGFALGASGGDCIQLRDPSGHIVAQANTAAMEADQVMSLQDGKYQTTFLPTPGYPNDESGLTALREGIPAEAPDVVISEVLLGNVSALPDENGIYSDVIELHNVSGQAVHLGNYYLSDSGERRLRWRLPAVTLEPDAYLVIYCDGENYVAETGQIHANFGLTHGETLILTDNMGSCSTLTVAHCGEDISMALCEGAYVESGASPGYPNTEEGMILFWESRVDTAAPLRISEVLLSSAEVPYDGSFCDVVEITNYSAAAVSTADWYLSDGGDPYEYALPERILEPGECMMVVCSPQTTGFSLSADEILRLTTPAYFVASVIDCITPETGKSISLNMGEDEASYCFAEVTLGYANSGENHTSYLESQLSSGLRISEVMSANSSYLKGYNSTTADWIELYNASGSSVRLSDYCLTDDAGNLSKYALPDQELGAGEYIVIFLKGDTTNLRSGYSVLPFSLSSEGEQLYLTKLDTVVDYVLVPELAADESYGRPGDSAAFSLLASPSPNKANGSAAEKCAMPTAQTAPGCYDDIAYLDVVFSGEGDIYYTTDCNVPGSRAKLYTGPVRITETTVFRLVCRQSGKMESEVLTVTYLINEKDNLPVVSLVLEPDDLWSYNTGIYVMGPGASGVSPFKGANFWQDWEKAASVSLYETDGGGFSLNCGVKIFGGYTRALGKKAFSCLFRDVYGDSELRYPLFGEGKPETYEAFLLRAAGQDAYNARMRDVVFTSLVGEYTDVSVQDYKPVVLYLNGEYWGIYYIREKMNESYLATYYELDETEAEIVKYGGWTNSEYRALLAYTTSHDMAVPEYYDYVCSRIDIDSYLDFLIAEMWIANTDDGNVKFFQNADGKWTWLFYDTDFAGWDASTNFVRRYLYPSNIGTSDTNCKTFAVRLMANEGFREKFLTRLAWQMNTIWTEENVVGRIDEIAALLEGDMAKESDRWGTGYSQWENSVELLRTFARKRNSYMLSHIQSWFGLTDEEMRSYGFVIE